MKKILIVVFVACLWFASSAQACGTNFAYSVYTFAGIPGPNLSPVPLAGSKYIGLFFDANKVISLIKSYPGESGYVVQTDRTCGGYTFYTFSGGKWRKV